MKFNLNTRPGFIFLGVFFYLITFLIPALYTIHLQLPDQRSLHTTQGTLTLKSIRKRGKIITLRDGKNEHQLTCRTRYGGDHTCHPKLPPDLINGATGTAQWYEQPIFTFVTQKRLARLTINGEILISLAQTKRNIELRISNTPTDTITISIFYFATMTIAYLIYFRRKRT